MKTIKYLALNYLQHNKKKTIAIIISIVLAATLVFTVSLAASILHKHNYDSIVKYYGNYSAIYRNLNYNEIFRFKNDKEVKNILIYQNYSIVDNLNIYSFENDIYKYFYLVEGRYPTNNREIIVDENYFQDYFLKNKDSLMNKNIGNFKVVGVYEKSNIILDDDYQTYLKFQSGDFASLTSLNAITIDKINSNLKTNFVITYKLNKNIINKIIDTTTTYNNKISSYSNSSNRMVYQNTYINYSYLGLYGIGPNSSNIYELAIILIISTIIALFCSLIIINTFQISLNDERKELGTLKSIGLSDKNIHKLIYYQVFIIGIISILIGFFLTILLSTYTIHIINNYLKDIAEIKYQLYIYLNYFIISFIVLIASIIISGRKIANNLSKVSAISVIKENKKYNINKTKENYPIIRKLFGNIGELSFKNRSRNKKQFSPITISLVISVILFMAFEIFIDFMKIQNKLYNDYLPDSSVIINNKSIEFNIINDLKSLKYKKEMIYYRLTSTLMIGGVPSDIALKKGYAQKENNLIFLVGLDDETYYRLVKKYNIKNGETIFNNNIHNDSENLEMFESLNTTKLYSDYAKTEYYSFDRIHLINDTSLSNHAIIVPINEYKSIVTNYMIFSPESISGKEYALNNMQIDIYSSNIVELDKEMKEILQKYSVNDYDYAAYSLENYNAYKQAKLMEIILLFAMIFIVLIIITSLLNIITINLKSRKKEFAILKSIGISNRRLRKMLNLENIFLNIKVILISYPISALVVYVLMILFKNIMGDNKNALTFPYIRYCYILIILAVLTIIINVYSIKIVRRKNIIDSIKKNSI